ncbi:MAG: M4 family metallopeptidase [Jatrophihabitantaceae bacterium]
MYNPSLAGDPNCYSSTIPSTETHSATGPGKHWFYLASEGSNPTNGQPTSPTCNGSTVTGISIQTVGKIFYDAMLAKTTGMTYLQYRDGEDHDRQPAQQGQHRSSHLPAAAAHRAATHHGNGLRL